MGDGRTIHSGPSFVRLRYIHSLVSRLLPVFNVDHVTFEMLGIDLGIEVIRTHIYTMYIIESVDSIHVSRDGPTLPYYVIHYKKPKTQFR